jgi:nitrate reductase beta subunit
MDEEEMYEMFRLLAIAKYADRYVIPTAHAEQAHALEDRRPGRIPDCHAVPGAPPVPDGRHQARRLTWASSCGASCPTPPR